MYYSRNAGSRDKGQHRAEPNGLHGAHAKNHGSFLKHGSPTRRDSKFYQSIDKNKPKDSFTMQHKNWNVSSNTSTVNGSYQLKSQMSNVSWVNSQATSNAAGTTPFKDTLRRASNTPPQK